MIDLLLLPLFRRQKRYAGDGYIAGEVPGLLTVGGVPSRRRVLFFDEATGDVVASTFSADDGTYRVENLNRARSYMVIGLDALDQYRAAIQDKIVPVEM